MTETVTIRLDEGNDFRLTSHENYWALNPKELFLLSAAKCAGLTLLALLKKDRPAVKGLELTVSGVLSTPTLMPESVFSSFSVIYNVECTTIEEQTRISRIVTLTHDKYCGLMRMLRMIAPVESEIAVVSTESAFA